MKSIILFLLSFSLINLSFAQSESYRPIPLNSENWEPTSGELEFQDEDGIQKMILTPEVGKVIAKDFVFTDGSVEFTTRDTKALSFFFRMENKDETEYFYLRTARAGNPNAMDAFQYAPYIKGVLMWNTYPQFQSNADYSIEGENNFKFVISGSRMLIYINSDTPSLEVDHLEGNFDLGKIGFEGEAEVMNFKISKDVEGLSPASLPDPTAYDPRYIREWAVSEAIDIPGKMDFSYEYLPSPETKWTLERTERRGFLNLSRMFGNVEGKRLNWLKLAIESDTDQTKTLDLGFLTEVWVFLNGQMAYLDKNLEARLMAKTPDGRLSVENSAVPLALKKGRNELIIGIANTAWGTGAMARFENMKGINVMPDPTFDSRLIKLSKESLSTFEGDYAIPGYDEALVVKSDEYSININGPVFNGTAYPKSESRFFVREMELDIQFNFNSDGQVSEMDFVVDGASVLKVQKKN